MKLLKQDKDYNCGVYAVDFFLKLFATGMGIESIQKELNTNPDNGTTPQSIVKFLEKMFGKGKVQFKTNVQIEWLGNHAPCLVNYTYEGDGHWGVLLGETPAVGDDKHIFGYHKPCVYLYNPAAGEIDVMLLTDFYSVFYSERNFNQSIIYICNQ